MKSSVSALVETTISETMDEMKLFSDDEEEQEDEVMSESMLASIPSAYSYEWR